MRRSCDHAGVKARPLPPPPPPQPLASQQCCTAAALWVSLGCGCWEGLSGGNGGVLQDQAALCAPLPGAAQAANPADSLLKVPPAPCPGDACGGRAPCQCPSLLLRVNLSGAEFSPVFLQTAHWRTEQRRFCNWETSVHERRNRSDIAWLLTLHIKAESLTRLRSQHQGCQGS